MALSHSSLVFVAAQAALVGQEKKAEKAEKKAQVMEKRAEKAEKKTEAVEKTVEKKEKKAKKVEKKEGM